LFIFEQSQHCLVLLFVPVLQAFVGEDDCNFFFGFEQSSGSYEDLDPAFTFASTYNKDLL
jgi:hypothetical protein